MIPELYIDHIRSAPNGENIQIGSIVRAIGADAGLIGRVYSMNDNLITIINFAGPNNQQRFNSSSHNITNLELIKCTIKFKQ